MNDNAGDHKRPPLGEGNIILQLCLASVSLPRNGLHYFVLKTRTLMYCALAFKPNNNLKISISK